MEVTKLIENLVCGRCCPKHFNCMNSSKSQNPRKLVLLLCRFYRWRNGNPEKWDNLPKDRHLNPGCGGSCTPHSLRHLLAFSWLALSTGTLGGIFRKPGLSLLPWGPWLLVTFLFPASSESHLLPDLHRPPFSWKRNVTHSLLLSRVFLIYSTPRVSLFPPLAFCLPDFTLNH